MNNFLLKTLFPKFCLGCNLEGTYLCEDCKELLEISQFDYCLCSQRPLLLGPDCENGKCQRCKDKNLSGLYFALSYKEKSLARKLIHNFKYPPYLKDLAKILASLLIEHFVLTHKNTNLIWQNSVLIPVPLHLEKLKSRGYNQSEELVKELAKILQIPIISNLLIKTKPTKPQMELKKAERENNLSDAFCVSKNCPELGQLSQFSKVFLVDDVYTTGSTMEECAEVLKAAGAKSVWGIALAREG